MFLGEIINLFEGETFNSVCEAKVTEVGFDLVVAKGSYNHSIRDFVEQINTEKYGVSPIVDFPIEDWFVEPLPGTGLIYHFYDCFYYKSDGEEQRKAALQQRKENRQKEPDEYDQEHPFL